jgi:tetratricopeptide (TPR) repeat protein
MGSLYLGYTYLALSKHAESAQHLNNAAEHDPNNVDAWYHLSKVNGQLSKHYFEILQKQFPDSVETFLARSHFHESSANWEPAHQQLSNALAKQPGNQQLSQRLEWLKSLASGKPADPPASDTEIDGSTRYLHAPPAGEAIRSAVDAERRATQASLKTAPPTAKSLYHLAEGYQALSFLSSLWVLELDASSYRAHQLKAQSFEAAGRVEEAIAEYREALARKPDLQTVHFAIGNLYWRNNRMEEALPELEAELKLNPRDPHAHYEIGDILFAANKQDAAAKHFEEAIRLAPSMVEAHLVLERIANAKGDFDKALLHLKKAAEVSPQNPTPHYRMWLLYRRLGKTAEAQAARNAFEERRAQSGESGTN